MCKASLSTLSAISMPMENDQEISFSKDISVLQPRIQLMRRKWRNSVVQQVIGGILMVSLLLSIL